MSTIDSAGPAAPTQARAGVEMTLVFCVRGASSWLVGVASTPGAAAAMQHDDQTALAARYGRDATTSAHYAAITVPVDELLDADAIAGMLDDAACEVA